MYPRECREQKGDFINEKHTAWDAFSSFLKINIIVFRFTVSVYSHVNYIYISFSIGLAHEHEKENKWYFISVMLFFFTISLYNIFVL